MYKASWEGRIAGIEAQLAEVSTSVIRSKIDGRNTFENKGKAEVELADVLRDLELELANAKQESEEASSAVLESLAIVR